MQGKAWIAYLGHTLGQGTEHLQVRLTSGNSKGLPKIWQFGLSIREGQPTDLISFVVSKNHSFRGSLTPE